MGTFREIERRKFGVTVIGGDVVSNCRFHWIIKPAKEFRFSISGNRCTPFFLSLIPHNTTKGTISFSRLIHIVLGTSTGPKIRAAIIESVLSIYVVCLSFIAVFQTKHLAVHVDHSLFTVNHDSPDGIPARNPLFRSPSTPPVFGYFRKYIQVNKCYLSFSKRNNTVINRFFHNISLSREAHFECIH